MYNEQLVKIAKFNVLQFSQKSTIYTPVSPRTTVLSLQVHVTLAIIEGLSKQG